MKKLQVGVKRRQVAAVTILCIIRYVVGTCKGVFIRPPHKADLNFATDIVVAPA